ncbi:MAG TPA: HprK-related kinase A, partial [Burkholderiaceae bacterium]|nr:HprK-related kinase A [Burkholderiaceae bacterium]
DLAVVPTTGLRRWINPLIALDFDGDRPFDPLPAAQAFPLLEWAMNWCVTSNAHQYLIFHSAVLAKNDLAVVLPAPPGSGKSTLCAALMLSGWRLLSDELALLRPETGKLTPFVRPVSLKNASIPLIADRFAEAVFTKSVHETMKGTVAHLQPTSASLADNTKPATPQWLIFPKYAAGQSLSLEPLEKAAAAVELAKNAFNLPAQGVRGFHALVDMVQASQCFRMGYSSLDDAIRQFDALASAGPQADVPA